MNFLAYWIRIGLGLAIASVTFVIAIIIFLCILSAIGGLMKHSDKKEN